MSSIRVARLFRYPVKSLGGEELDAIEITHSGPIGDRNWAIIDREAAEIRSAKRWPALLGLRARYLESPVADAFDSAVAQVELEAPDGSKVRSDDPDAGSWLGRQLDRDAFLAPRAPAHRREHYRLARGFRDPREIAADIDLLADETLPDFGETEDALLAQLKTHATPPGSYVDAYPLHLLTTNSLDALAAASGLDTSVARFRPNLLVTADEGNAQLEMGWIGKRLAIGAAVVKVRSPTTRCSMPMRAQPLFGLHSEPRLTRAIVDHCQRALGVNLLVETEGVVRRGDPVQLLD